MPLYSDPAGYYYSTGSSSGVYSTPYSAPYYTSSSPYVGGSSYGRPYSIPSLSSYSSSASSRYQPKLSTITETPLGSRGLIPLTRLNSPKIITTPVSSSYHHHTSSKYIPPRPININTADIDVSASRYRRRDLKSPKSSPKSSSSLTIKQVNESPPIPTPTIQVSTSLAEQQPSQQCHQQTVTSPYMPRADGTDPTPALNRSTIKRNRAVVRLSTVRSKSIRDRSIPRSSKMNEIEKDVDDHKKPKIESSKLMDSDEKTNETIENNSSTSWRDKFGEDLVPKPFGVTKKSPGELLLERYIIPSKYNKDEVFVNSINVTPPTAIDNDLEKTDSNSEIIIELDPLMQSAIRRLSIPKCPDFQDFCEDISSDKIDDDLNAGELRRRASIIQEQEIELLNQLQKSASGSFQLIHLERNESGSDLTTDSGNRKSTKRKSLTKKPKKVRHKITATVDIQNPTLTPIIQESFDEDNGNVVPTKTVKPKFTFNVDEIEENHTIHQVFKLPKKKSIEKSPEIEEEAKVEEKSNKSLEKIELKKGIKNSPKKIKITKKTDPIKGVKSSPKKNTTEFKEENSKVSETIEKIDDKISEIATDLKSKPNETITGAKLTLIDTKSDKITDKKDNKDSGIPTPKTPIIKKKPITPKPLEILKLKKSDENKTVSPSTKSPIKKTSSPLNITKSDIMSQTTPEHFKFDEDSIKETEKQNPIILRSAKHPISPLAIDHKKSESPRVSVDKPKSIIGKIQKSDSTEDFWTQIGTHDHSISPLTNDHKKNESSGISVDTPKPIINKIQKSDSGEDFWTQIGSRETLYMSKRKRNVIESQWDKRETLLDNQTIDDVKNLKEIKSKVHDQKNEALKQADEQNGSVELGKRAHSNESALCAKKKGLVKKEHEESLEEDKSKNILQKENEITENRNLEKLSLNNILNENLINKNNHQIIKKSKEIPKKIPDSSETYKKLNQSFTTTPTDSEKPNTTETTIKIPEQKQKNTTANIPKIETGINAKSPEIKSKEIDLNKNKLDPQKSAPPSPEFETSVSTIKSDVAGTIVVPTPKTATTTVETSSGLKKKKDINKNKDEQIKIKKTSTDLNHFDDGKSKTEYGSPGTLVAEIAEQKNESNENVSLQKLLITSTTSSPSPTPASANITDNKQQKKKISPPTTLKTPESPALDKLSSTDIKISSTTTTTPTKTDNKYKKPSTNIIKLDEKIGKIPDNKNICNDANSIDKIEENITNKIKGNNNNNNIKEIENHQQQLQRKENENEKQHNEENKKENQQHFEHQLSCKNVLMKFATVNNLNQCLLDVDADIEDIIEENNNNNSDSEDNYSSYSSDNNNNKDLSESMKRKDKKNKHKHQQKEEKQFNRNKVKLDHTKKCYVKDEAPPYPLIATPRPLWKPEKFIIPESDTDDDDDDSDTDNSDNDNNDGGGSDGSDNECSTSSGSSTDDELDDELNPNKSDIIRMSTCSNDSGFEGGTAPSSPKKMLDCDVNCHKKCEKLTANLCGVNQKLIVEALLSVRRGADARDSPSTPPSYNPAYKIESNNDDYDETSYTYAQFQKSGRITAPATNIPRFKKYSVEDFHFLTVLGKGSFGKVLLAELRNTDYYYAVKCLKKDVVLEDDDVECTLIERKVLALGTKHPYLCHLFCTFQTESHLFFVMEYLNGGDLMFHIQQSGRFPEPRARFYAAEIISGLKFLHKKGIIYRDLKLDNVLLDFDGHVRIADFGMCKLQIYLDKTADSFCGTPDYMAPEIIKGDNYNQNVDWWSFGVLLYEMLIGQSPFSGCDEEYLFWSICNEMPLYPLMLSQESTSLLKALLEKDSNKRIGSQYSPAGDIYSHPFFNQIEWDRLEKRQIEPPFKPQVKHPLDTQYFDKTFTRERVRLTPIDKDILQSMDQAQFQGFSYTNPNATLE